MDAEAYIQQLKALLPSGQAWSAERGSAMHAVLQIIASSLARAHGRAESLVRESIPSTTSEMLEDWERAAGLPDNCSILADTRPERVAALVAKITRRGGQSKQFFIELAQSLGYSITIKEHKPFMCGISRCGTDPLTTGHQVRFIWNVTVHGSKLLYLRCGKSTLNQRLLAFRQADDLACLFMKLKPAHTHLIIGYEGVTP